VSERKSRLPNSSQRLDRTVVERDDGQFEIRLIDDAPGPFPSRGFAQAIADKYTGEDPPKRRRPAAERQRRRREKQRHDAERDISVTERESERDSVTTAPLIPEFDLQNGGPNALAN
jgi:hypothetical protein